MSDKLNNINDVIIFDANEEDEKYIEMSLANMGIHEEVDVDLEGVDSAVEVVGIEQLPQKSDKKRKESKKRKRSVKTSKVKSGKKEVRKMAVSKETIAELIDVVGALAGISTSIKDLPEDKKRRVFELIRGKRFLKYRGRPILDPEKLKFKTVKVGTKEYSIPEIPEDVKKALAEAIKFAGENDVTLVSAFDQLGIRINPRSKSSKNAVKILTYYLMKEGYFDNQPALALKVLKKYFRKKNANSFKDLLEAYKIKMAKMYLGRLAEFGLGAGRSYEDVLKSLGIDNVTAGDTPSSFMTAMEKVSEAFSTAVKNSMSDIIKVVKEKGTHDPAIGKIVYTSPKGNRYVLHVTKDGREVVLPLKTDMYIENKKKEKEIIENTLKSRFEGKLARKYVTEIKRTTGAKRRRRKKSEEQSKEQVVVSDEVYYSPEDEDVLIYGLTEEIAEFVDDAVSEILDGIAEDYYYGMFDPDIADDIDTVGDVITDLFGYTRGEQIKNAGLSFATFVGSMFVTQEFGKIAGRWISEKYPNLSEYKARGITKVLSGTAIFFAPELLRRFANLELPAIIGVTAKVAGALAVGLGLYNILREDELISISEEPFYAVSEKVLNAIGYNPITPEVIESNTEVKVEESVEEEVAEEVEDIVLELPIGEQVDSNLPAPVDGVEFGVEL